MKQILSVLLCMVLIFGIMCVPAFAVGLDPKLLSNPYDLTVTQMAADDGNPFGGVNMKYKIDKVPLGYEDEAGSYYYKLDFEQKVGEKGAWESIGGPLIDELVEGFYMESAGKYKYSNTWTDDNSKTLVSYRVRMVIDDTDAFSVPIHVTPWSNVATIGIKTSTWAVTEIEKAMSYGLIPDSIKGDLTTPITREEFAELAVRLYEVYTGVKATPVPENTFSDCKNPEVLKAFQLKIVNGVGNGKFDPKALTNREQIAAMLYRAVTVISPNADMSTSGAPVFKDEKSITSYFLENVKFMSKKEFIKGSDGKFDPKGTCTREMAVIIATRVYESYKK